MKYTKKFASLLLALVMVLSLAATAAAADGTPADTSMEGELTSGSITINSAVSGEAYSAYQILYLESYDLASKAYAYKANSAWEAWLKENAKNYLAFDEQGYVTWKKDADAAAFAQLLKGNLSGKTAAATAAVTDGAASVTLNDLKLGYYLVDTTVGTLCALDTTTPTATINEKHTLPTIEKSVQEDSKMPAEGGWGVENDADIGQTVKFKITVHAQKGARDYVVHDKMSAGLTFDANSVVIKAGDATLTPYSAENLDNYHYTVVTSGLETENPCGFHIQFKQAYLDTISAATDLVITYSATLNESAVTGNVGNPNETWLKYGDVSKTEPAQTTTYTYAFELVKTKDNKAVLNGAKFKLYDAATGGNEILLALAADGSYYVTTVKADATVITAGKVTVKGLDSGTYWLEETEAPAGYNKLKERVAIKIEGADLIATMDGSTWEAGGVHVTNYTGTELPETGDLGTAVFYAVGSILLVSAAVLLITKKRMRAAE